MKDIWNKYQSKFKEIKFLQFLNRKFKSLSVQLVYKSFLMFYAFKRKETPYWAKNIVLGTLGYILSPIDMLPDLTPLFGYTDDISVLSYGLVMISCYINNEVRDQAIAGTKNIYGEFDLSLIEDISPDTDSGQ
jgi:uncharacterized membrane protein YkvA (DUF1232 family)